MSVYDLFMEKKCCKQDSKVSIHNILNSSQLTKMKKSIPDMSLP